MNPSVPSSLLTKRDVARLLSVSIRTVDNLRKERNLRSVKIGELVRFDMKDIQEFINRRRSRRPPLFVSHFQKGI